VSFPKIRKKYVLLFILAVFFLRVLYGLYKPLPENLNFKSNAYEVSEVEFLRDITYQQDGKRIIEQEIFSRIFQMIEEAQNFIVIDMFLFNDDYEKDGDNNFVTLSEDLVSKIIQAKEERPDLKVVFITDPLNNFYGVYESPYLKRLKANDVEVIVTNLDKLRDSNYIYSGVYNLIFRWFGVAGKGYIRNPFSSTAPKVNGRGYLKLLNFKANHRKIILTEKEGLITSANPHDASSLHSNIAFAFKGEFIKEALKAEEAVANLSNKTLGINMEDVLVTGEGSGAKMTILTEKKIKDEILQEIAKTQKGDSIFIAMFYFSDRDIVNFLKDAAKRDVDIKIILDANKDAFGIEKNGIPNRQVAAELMKASQGKINIRWYYTNGEQFHTKLIKIDHQESSVVIAGSANYTRRNLDNFNLEANVKVEVEKDHPLSNEITEYLEGMWNNDGGSFTLDVEEFYEDKPVKWFIYYLQEKLGLSTF
jgi:phosphatidylserine/phosphatidylglycerophosphate/cardiolipin synthase-like enzyme